MKFKITIEKEDEKKRQTLWEVEEFYTNQNGLIAYCDNLEIGAKFDKNNKIIIEVEK